MSDTMTAGDLGLTQEEHDRMPEGVRDQLRKAKKMERELADRDARDAATAKEIALLRARIPIDTPVGQMFADGYKDEISAEAMKAKWDELGLGEPKAPGATGAGPTEEELTEQRRLAGVGAGGETTGTVKFEDALRAAATESDVMALVNQAPPEARVTTPAVD